MDPGGAIDTTVLGDNGFRVLVRSRIRRLLEACAVRPLTLVVAPAGYGKSVAVEQWARSSDRTVLWVSVEPRHNDPVLFFRAILDALDASSIADTQAARETLQGSSAYASDETLQAVADALKQPRASAVLVFDDFHEITNEVVIDAVNRLRDLVAGVVSLMIVSRHDPPIAVGRERASGRLSEVRQRDLSFTEDEVAELATLEGAELTDAQVGTLSAVTEGWGAVIRLALLWLQRSGSQHVIQALSSDTIEIASYVIEEILGELDAEERRFVLSSAIADELPDGLAEQLTDRADAARRMAELSTAGFPLRRDPTTGVFEMHNLVRDLLRSELRHTTDVDLRQLNARAADWYRSRDPATAVEYTIRSGDVDRAIELLADATGPLANSGQSRTLYELTDRLLRLVEEPSLLLLVSRGTALYGLGIDPDELWSRADQIITKMEALPADPGVSFADGSNPRAWTVRSHLPWARATVARLRGDVEGVLAERDHLPSDVGFLEGDIGEALAWLGRYDEALDLLEINARHAARIEYAPGAVHCLGVRSLILAESGHLDAAESLARDALATATKHGFAQLRYAMYSRLALAFLTWLRGEFAASTVALNEMQDFVDHADDIPILVQHAILRSNVRWSAGDRLGARATLELASTTRTGRPVSGHFGERLVLEQARMDLLEGETFESDRWFAARLESSQPARTMREELVLRLYGVVSGNDLTRAEEPLPVGLNPTMLSEHRATILRALAYRASDQNEEANALLSGEQARAERLGLRAVLLDEGTLPGSGRDERKRMQRPSETLPDAPVFIEPLTDRERDVLALMQTHMSYPEIADELYVSLNTVRSHTKSIFRKLAVTRRSDAIARARDYQLL